MLYLKTFENYNLDEPEPEKTIKVYPDGVRLTTFIEDGEVDKSWTKRKIVATLALQLAKIEVATEQAKKASPIDK